MLLETGDDLDPDEPIAFVRLRNKVAHGEIDALHIVDLSDYDAIAEKLANEHEEKMRRFVAEWYKTAPDVQEGHIRNHKWKADDIDAQANAKIPC